MTDAPHVPVLKEETLGFLQPGQGKRIIDGTFGFGGHSLAMLEAGAEVLGLDLDAVAVDTCRRISGDRHRLKCEQISFRHLDRAMAAGGLGNRWTAFCWIWASVPSSSTIRTRDSVTGPTARWICVSTRTAVSTAAELLAGELGAGNRRPDLEMGRGEGEPSHRPGPGQGPRTKRRWTRRTVARGDRKHSAPGHETPAGPQPRFPGPAHRRERGTRRP